MKKLPDVWFVSLLSLALLLAACATPRETVDVGERLAQMGYRIVEDQQRIPSYRVNGWTHVDDRNLVIRAGVNDRYLVELNSFCLGLDSAFSIGFTTPGRLSRLDRFEDILVRSPGSGLERCPIRNIYRLENL